MENEIMDYGYGFDSNGEPIDESTVDEFYRIATHEILDKSEIANYAVVDIDEDSFNVYATGLLTGTLCDYIIKCQLFTDGGAKEILNECLKEDAMYPDFNSDNNWAELYIDVEVENNEIKSVSLVDASVYDDFVYSDYYTKKIDEIYDIDKITEYVRKLVFTAVRDIAITLSNI